MSNLAGYTLAIMADLRSSGGARVAIGQLSESVARQRIYNAASRAGLQVTVTVQSFDGKRYAVGTVTGPTTNQEKLTEARRLIVEVLEAVTDGGYHDDEIERPLRRAATNLDIATRAMKGHQ